MSPPISATLLNLLRFSKRSNECTWQNIAEVLEPQFFRDMPLPDVVTIVLAAYGEALAEKRFQMGNPHYAARDLILAPIKGSCAVEWRGPASLQTQYSVEEFFNSILKQMVTELSLSRVDWLDPDQLSVLTQ